MWSATARAVRDEHYIVDLCDVLLGRKALRQYRGLGFLVGDTGMPLPVDAYYPDLKLVIEYRERQHSEAVPLFDRRMTASGMYRDEQRRLYDQRRRELLPKHGIELVELDYSEFAHESRKRLMRDSARDTAVLHGKLSKWLVEPA
jgi:hypothetical protein